MEKEIDLKNFELKKSQLETKKEEIEKENITESLEIKNISKAKQNEDISREKILQPIASKNIETVVNGPKDVSASENCDKFTYEFDDDNVEKCNYELFQETFIHDLSEADFSAFNDNFAVNTNVLATCPNTHSTTLNKDNKEDKMADSFTVHRFITENAPGESDDEDDDSSSFDFSSDDDQKFLTFEDNLDEKEENKKIKTAGELGLEDLPPIEYLKIEVSDDVELQQVGTIHSIIDVLLIVKGERGSTPLDVDSVLMSEDRKVIGQVFEIFGPVVSPFYSIRFNSPEDVIQLPISSPVFFAPKVPDWTRPVFQQQLRIKGSDASWVDNNEPPEEYLEYSDDEEEKIARRKLKGGESSEEGEESHSIKTMEKSIGLSKNKKHKQEKRSSKKENPFYKKTHGRNFFNTRQEVPFMKQNMPFSPQGIRPSSFQPNFTLQNNYFTPQPSTNLCSNLQQQILQQQQSIIQQQQQLELLKAQLLQSNSVPQQNPSNQVFQQGNTSLYLQQSHTTSQPSMLPHHQAFNHLFASQAIFNNLSTSNSSTNATLKPPQHISSFGDYNNN